MMNHFQPFTLFNEDNVNLMISTEASWCNILTLNIYITLGYIRYMCDTRTADDAKAKHVYQVQEV